MTGGIYFAADTEKDHIFVLQTDEDADEEWAKWVPKPEKIVKYLKHLKCVKEREEGKVGTRVYGEDHNEDPKDSDNSDHLILRVRIKEGKFSLLVDETWSTDKRNKRRPKNVWKYLETEIWWELNSITENIISLAKKEKRMRTENCEETAKQEKRKKENEAEGERKKQKKDAGRKKGSFVPYGTNYYKLLDTDGKPVTRKYREVREFIDLVASKGYGEIQPHKDGVRKELYHVVLDSNITVHMYASWNSGEMLIICQIRQKHWELRKVDIEETLGEWADMWNERFTNENPETEPEDEDEEDQRIYSALAESDDESHGEDQDGKENQKDDKGEGGRCKKRKETPFEIFKQAKNQCWKFLSEEDREEDDQLFERFLSEDREGEEKWEDINDQEMRFRSLFRGMEWYGKGGREMNSERMRKTEDKTPRIGNKQITDYSSESDEEQERFPDLTGLAGKTDDEKKEWMKENLIGWSIMGVAVEVKNWNTTSDGKKGNVFVEMPYPLPDMYIPRVNFVGKAWDYSYEEVRNKLIFLDIRIGRNGKVTGKNGRIVNRDLLTGTKIVVGWIGKEGSESRAKKLKAIKGMAQGGGRISMMDLSMTAEKMFTNYKVVDTLLEVIKDKVGVVAHKECSNFVHSFARSPTLTTEATGKMRDDKRMWDEISKVDGMVNGFKRKMCTGQKEILASGNKQDAPRLNVIPQDRGKEMEETINTIANQVKRKVLLEQLKEPVRTRDEPTRKVYEANLGYRKNTEPEPATEPEASGTAGRKDRSRSRGRMQNRGQTGQTRQVFLTPNRYHQSQSSSSGIDRSGHQYGHQTHYHNVQGINQNQWQSQQYQQNQWYDQSKNQYEQHGRQQHHGGYYGQDGAKWHQQSNRR